MPDPAVPLLRMQHPPACMINDMRVPSPPPLRCGCGQPPRQASQNTSGEQPLRGQPPHQPSFSTATSTFATWSL